MSEIIVTLDGSHTIKDKRTGETYHSTNGAIQESMWIFIDKGLHYLTNSSSTIKVLEIGFGTGLNAFLTVLNKPNGKTIEYTGIELYPLPLEIIRQLNFARTSEEKDIFHQFHSVESGKQKTIIPDFNFELHHTSFIEYTTDKKFDVLYFDAFSPQEEPGLWTAEMIQKCADLLHQNGILVTYCAQGQFKRNLKLAGFEVQELPGPPGKRQITRAIKK